MGVSLSKSKAKKQTPVAAPMTAPHLLNIKDAAAYLSATVWFLRSLVWERRIPFVKFGNRYCFDRADLDRFVDAEKTAVRA